MSTFLSKLFKPKWQSKNKITRLDALKTLSEVQDDEKSILISVAKTDTDNEVKRAAIGKLSDTQALADLHKESNEEIRQEIETRLQTLANSQSLSIFDLVLDPQLLTEMITSASNPEPFINGLARIEDSNTLLSIAQKGKTSKIRQAAAELINTENDLKALIQEVKSKDKGVYQIAKRQLDRLNKEAKSLADTQAQIDSLISSIEEHSKTENTKQYDSKLESLLQKWATVSEKADSQAKSKFESFKQQCETRIEAVREEEHQRTQAELMAKAGGDEQQATLLTLEQTLEQLRTHAATTQDLSSLDALIKTQETRWTEATKQSEVEKVQAKHYQVLMTALRGYLKSLKAFHEQYENLSETIQEFETERQSTNASDKLGGTSKSLTRLLSTIDWPSDFPCPQLILDANKALGKSKDLSKKLAQNAEETLKEIEKKIAELDDLLDDKQVKRSSASLKHIQNLISRLSSKQGEKVHNQLNHRIKQLNELRDWQGYASTPRQQELCEQMERLAEQTMPPQDKAEKIKAMQSEWKSLGGAKDESVWQRFKTASDKAFEPCKAYFSEQSALKENNLSKRQTLIEQLETFVKSNDWSSPDWKAANTINKKARQEWRDAYPVDHKANRPLQKQFNHLLDELDGLLDGERSKNLELKTQIVEQAENLAEEGDLKTAMTIAKQLQKDWQAVGITEHKKDRALWKRFRAACDGVFQRRDQQRESQKEELNASIDASKAFISKFTEKLETLGNLDTDQTKALLDEIRQENKALPVLSGKPQTKHHDAYEAIVKKAKNHIKSLKNIGIKKSWLEAARQSTIIREAFAAKDFDAQTIETALQSNAAPLPSDMETVLKELWISVKATSVHASKIITHENARVSCIRCEIASGLDSPEADKELRMQLQVTRLSEGLSSAESLSREDQLIDLLQSWYGSVGLSPSDYEMFEERISECINALF